MCGARGAAPSSSPSAAAADQLRRTFENHRLSGVLVGRSRVGPAADSDAIGMVRRDALAAAVAAAPPHRSRARSAAQCRRTRRRGIRGGAAIPAARRIARRDACALRRSAAARLVGRRLRARARARAAARRRRRSRRGAAAETDEVSRGRLSWIRGTTGRDGRRRRIRAADDAAGGRAQPAASTRSS